MLTGGCSEILERQAVIFVSAQQDNMYMMWQLFVQMHNFRRLGIESDAVSLVATYGSESEQLRILRSKSTATVISMPDTRADRSYTPSIYYHLVKKYVDKYKPTEAIFFHDNDIVFRQLPLFHQMVCDDVNYMSDTTNYLGASLYDAEDIEMMCAAIGIDPEMVIERQFAGGAQFIIKNSTAEFWDTVEHKSVALNKSMQSKSFVGRQRKKKRPDPWMAGMWALQWEMWQRGMATMVHPELNFTWPTYSAKTWNAVKILHNAGVMPNQSNVMFHKGSYVDRSPFYDDLSHVSSDFASWYYAQEVLGARKLFDPGF